MPCRPRIWWPLIVALLVCDTGPLRAQTPRLQLPPPPPASGGLAPVPGAPSPAIGGGLSLPPPPTSTLGAPAFDPYSSGAAPSLNAPPANLFNSGTPAGTAAPGANPATAPWNTMPPGYGGTPAPSTAPWGAPPGAASPYGVGGPSTPESLFPNGVFPQSPNSSTPPLRLFENLRLRETWLYGDGGPQLGINDIEMAVTMMLPNFLGTTSPLMISPNFALHLWDGPQPPAHSQFLPGSAYSAYLEAAYSTDHAKSIGADLALSLGVFSDFETLTSDSVRIQTLSYGWARLTPNMMLKLGINYLDRVDVKILPAVGVLWEPNPQTRLDIFFPRPKLSHLFSTVGTTDVWWYLAGEYGGGSWTVNYAPTGFSDQVDINDIRIMLGFDWVTQSGMRGMFEIGWVTQRELVYRYHPGESTGLNDTFMMRGGLAF